MSHAALVASPNGLPPRQSASLWLGVRCVRIHGVVRGAVDPAVAPGPGDRRPVRPAGGLVAEDLRARGLDDVVRGQLRRPGQLAQERGLGRSVVDPREIDPGVLVEDPVVVDDRMPGADVHLVIGRRLLGDVEDRRGVAGAEELADPDAPGCVVLGAADPAIGIEREVDGVVAGRLLQHREHLREAAVDQPEPGHPAADAPGREGVMHIVVIVHGQGDLLEVVHALDPPRRLAGALDGGEQQRDQDRDDRDHHEQFDQREPVAAPAHLGSTSREGRMDDYGGILHNGRTNVNLRGRACRAAWGDSAGEWGSRRPGR